MLGCVWVFFVFVFVFAGVGGGGVGVGGGGKELVILFTESFLCTFKLVMVLRLLMVCGLLIGYLAFSVCSMGLFVVHCVHGMWVCWSAL